MGCKKLDISKNYESVLTVVGKNPTTENLQVGNFLATKKGCVNYFPFGSEMPNRSFSSGEYRYGFNGKESDNEVSGNGNSYDYGFRIYSPRIAKFLSVDPLRDKFPMLTPYQFASNTPIWAIDIDGLEARVYTDNSYLPHSFLSVIDDNDIIHVYTFGQYGQEGGNWHDMGGIANEGSALVHLVGEDANKYIEHEFEQYKDEMSVFEISADKVDKQAIIDYYSNEMKNYSIPAKKVGTHAPTFANEKNGSEAVMYKPYSILPDNEIDFNCTSIMLNGLKKGGFNLDVIPLPWLVDSKLSSMAKDNPSSVTNVTDNEKNAAENNFNAPITLDEAVVKP